MSDAFQFPVKKAVVYWPVGTGDSTTIVAKPGEIVIQVDIRHLEKADDPDEPEWPVVDYLVKNLPRREKKPYLALFVLTHPDKDHIQGFGELLRKVHIGEIWHTPTIFRDMSEPLCDDAEAFVKEANRRCKAVQNDPGNIKSGDRLRIIGHDDILEADEFQALPDECKSRPGETIGIVDGVDFGEEFQAFIHAPFRDDQDEQKNKTSLALNIVIWEGKKYGQFFFFGDREYSTIKRIFETTEARVETTPYLYWHVMLCAHHCSKGVMYYKAKDEEEERFRKDIMDYFHKYARGGDGYVVSSSHSDFTDGEGDNPPHKKARGRYEAIVKPGRFICTHEYPSKKSPAPVVFHIDSDGFGFDDKRKKSVGPSGLASIVEKARGGNQPPNAQVGFGNSK